MFQFHTPLLIKLIARRIRWTRRKSRAKLDIRFEFTVISDDSVKRMRKLNKFEPGSLTQETPHPKVGSTFRTGDCLFCPVLVYGQSRLSTRNSL